MKWTDNEVSLAIKLVSENKNFKEIGEILGKSHSCVSSKMNYLGVKSSFIPGNNKGDTKYHEYDWILIQSEYDNGLSQEDIYKKYKNDISLRGIYWGAKNNKLILRNSSETIKLAWKNGKFKESDKIGVARYRQLCEFKFNVFHYPDKFDLKLIQELGWYKAKNRGDNPDGVSRDHMYSVKKGYLNGVAPYIINHPANCAIMKHSDNNKKNITCSISLEDLCDKINKW